MKKRILIILSVVLVVVFLAYRKKNDDRIVIGIIEPLEHKAMDEIVAGFTQTLSQQFHKKYVIEVENAQGDSNLQRAIYQKMKDAHYDLIVPIGTMPTQMAVSMIHNKPIVSLAANFTEVDRSKLKPCSIAVVHDEIPAEKILNFIHATYPNITQLSLLHSSSDKVLPEVEKTIAVGKALGITIKHHMVSTLPELMATAQALPKETQGIFVLKDHLIVSGVATLTQIAIQKKIPLITSDEGSADGGATFALGVHEKQIGVEGALLAARVLEGTQACSIPIQEMSELTIFVNHQTLLAQNLALEPIQNAANKLRYQVEFVGTPNTENK
ncbi:MAG: ABC transporter substrate-binding protein [Bdellovibrionota bacterium]